MSHPTPMTGQALADLPRSRFFRGTPADMAHDRAHPEVLLPSSEALFTQSNARVLLGHAPDGSLRFVSLPTQVYPAPTGTGEFGLGPGMYHHFDVAMYVGDLTYQLTLDGADAPVTLAAIADAETAYAEEFLPVTHARAGDLELTITSFAPVAADAASAPLAPAPLPGPAGAFHVLHVRNTGATPVSGSLVLRAGDLLVGHYEDASPALHELKRPQVDLRQQVLILTRPEGAVGIHLHEGRWTRTTAPFQAERPFHLEPGAEAVFETHIALGRGYSEVMPTLYALHLRSALDWLTLTLEFWRARLGRLTVETELPDEGALSAEVYIRCVLDNFNCLQTDPHGELIAHWQGAPSHGYGTVWGIDVEPTAVSIVPICPELATAAMRFFMTRSRVPKGPSDHSTPILVAPVIIARQILQTTGDVSFLEKPDVISALQSTMDDLLTLQSSREALFPSRYSSDGPVGRRYDYGTNAKVAYAFSSLAYLLRRTGHSEDAEVYTAVAEAVRSALEHTMLVDGPLGKQLSGGTNLDEEPGDFYLPEGVSYYDGEDTATMLAPLYGICETTDAPWVTYHRFARSLWCPNYDPEADALLWTARSPGVVDGTAFFSRLSGSVTRAEMREALSTLREVALDEVSGSVFWWPHGLEHKRSLTRCSQGQGAWAWFYLSRWLGLEVDSPSRILTLAPRGLLTRFAWEGFRAPSGAFDLAWDECHDSTTAQIRNRTDHLWTVRLGFRRPGDGAEGTLSWETRRLGPGEECTLEHRPRTQSYPAGEGMVRSTLVTHEVAALGDGDGVLFRRFGPAQLWGHWDPRRQWDFTAMPLAVRLVLANGTGEAWNGVRVELTVPEGWVGQGRLPRHWTPPEALVAGTVAVDLGDLPSGQRTVAPFWVQASRSSVRPIGWAGGNDHFHVPDQPGPGLDLRSPDPALAGETAFTAELHAMSVSGQEIVRRIEVPVRVSAG